VQPVTGGRSRVNRSGVGKGEDDFVVEKDRPQVQLEALQSRVYESYVAAAAQPEGRKQTAKHAPIARLP
jgi:hypothetical protein